MSAAVDLVENDDGGVVFIWGMAAWCWAPGDVVGRRLAAVQMVATGAATQLEAAAAFEVDDSTLRRWTRAWEQGGTDALVPDKRGPRRPSKLDADKVAQIVSLRAEGLSLRAVAEAVGTSADSVSRALRAPGVARPGPEAKTGGDAGTGLVPLARPPARAAERQAARAGALAGAAPVLCPGAGLPLAGALVAIPALMATGLLEAAAEVYETGRAAFYGLAQLVLAVVFATLVGEPRAEGLTRIDPVDLGRLVGLDRAPEVGTVRRRLGELASMGRAGELVRALARAHLAGGDGLGGLFYIDGHVRAYHGRSRLPKAHLARARLAMPGIVDTWVVDRRGDGVLVWTGPPGASLTAELRTACTEIRSLVGPGARPTICFDRGGWSPRLFAELLAAGFDILTYRKNKVRREPPSAFSVVEHTDDLGRNRRWHLADRAVRLAYKDGARGRYFACRQVTRLDPVTGHQTQVITTRADLGAPHVAEACFSRWREENFFRYMRPHYALDALDSYAKAPDDPARTVPNPAKAQAAAGVREAKAALAAAEAAVTRATLANGSSGVQGVTDAKAELEQRKAQACRIPARVPLGQLHPDAVLPDDEYKRILDAIRMATYNAESSLARALAPHYARAEDEVRSLLREVFRSPADLQVIGDELHVRVNPLSAPRRSRAAVALCEELNATQTAYPGTNLRLVYSVKKAA